MKFWIVKFVVVFTILLSTLSFASEVQPIMGAGTQSCGKYLQYRESKNDAETYEILHWVLGYISAYNEYVDTSEDGITAVTGTTPSSFLKPWLDKYCSENPLKNPYRGVSQLIKELKKAQ